jgi:hypothetical protein
MSYGELNEAGCTCGCDVEGDHDECDEECQE